MTMHEVIIKKRLNKFNLWTIRLFESKLISNIIILLLLLEIDVTLKAPIDWIFVKPIYFLIDG